MVNPIATYRIQFHKDFNFHQLKQIIEYLRDLGVGTLYASPVFKAVPGSNHGYDGLHPNQVNPEIGSQEELKQVADKLKSAGIGWLQDIVPNHMGFHHANEWLMDVLENGKASTYAPFFDIDWREKLMVPFLGASVEEAIANHELKIGKQAGKPVLQYYDSWYPLRPGSKISNEMSPESIRALVDDQHYRLCCWKETDKKINYRRFFTINSLICVNIQDEQVFNQYHQLIRQLVEEGIFDGLRIDHIDGLHDPSYYLQQLREMVGEDVHITVEKILQPTESLPGDWPVQGNSGYDFLALVNNLLTNEASRDAFTDYYQNLLDDYSSVDVQVYQKKAHILNCHMQGELDNLYRLFRESNLADKRQFAAIRQDELKEAIGEMLIQCPVYRFYGNAMPLSNEEGGALQRIFNKIRSQNQHLHRAVGILEQALIHHPHQNDEERNERAAYFYKRCMQFSGPLMAKGVEDTLMYTYNRFIVHNEVSDQPDAFGISKDEFHHAMVQRQHQWPYSLNATATHDTKRGEDVRARLNVLSDIPGRWLQQVASWREMNSAINSEIDANDEYFIYQSIVGAFPYEPSAIREFSGRLQQYLEKSLREAKTHSNWTTPDIEYENTVKSFVSDILQPDTPFMQSLEELLDAINDHGMINSLTQLILKFTCPGVPDVYQGCESWDLSFVDPDNRRPVDYQLRSQWLTSFSEDEHAVSFTDLWKERKSGKVKCWLTQSLFRLRREQPELFAQGEYIPLQVNGTYAENIIAFARKYRQQIYVVICPLHTAAINKDELPDPLAIDWKDTQVIIPADLQADWEDALSGSKITQRGELLISEALADAPFRLLKGRQAVRKRSAGVLMHITSLPSPFGIGDMGPEARHFADFLYRSKQHYWQLLPLNPTEGGQGYSPYSAVSGMAGNTLLISPELLARERLLDSRELGRYHTANNGKVDYAAVERLKEELLNKAFWSYLKRDDRKDFESFCEKESHWLEDYAQFRLLKQINGGKPWFEWKAAYKLRDAKALEALKDEHGDELYRIKWLQYIFNRQWTQLKQCCNERNICLIGDLPIYVSYDSADVWSNREIFALDDEGNALGVAGVPPDAFSADGQLWGMPVFRWDVLKERNFDWWIQRIQRNTALFDLVRIDHFRAFASYWEVPAGESTARNGTWKEGPGSAFFEAIESALGQLPFIAEDLGDVDETVFALRDQFALPGMKVLQFAFGNDMPHSVHIPHNHSPNFIVYTGTHDNNTTRGWYKDAGDEARDLLNQYAGSVVSEDEVHWVLARMAYASVANIAILPMQDILNLDESARMNIPASASNNWAWRLTPGQLDRSTEDKLRYMVHLYNR